MKGDTRYCYKGSTEYVIENGIIKGAEVLYHPEHTSIGEYILQELKATPAFIGQIDGKTGEKESFGKMMEKSVKCAMWLKEQNVQLGDIVGICTHNQMDMYVPFFASFYIGAISNPWCYMVSNTRISKEISRHFLTLSRPKILFADEVSADLIVECAKEIGMSLKVIVFGNRPGFQSLDEILATQDPKIVAEFQCSKLSSHTDPALICYTSGSSGLPKGVLHSHKSLLGLVHNFIAMDKADGTTISLVHSTLGWGIGRTSMLRATVSRETRIVYPEFTEETTFQLIEKFKVNWLHLIPKNCIRLQKSPARTKYDLSSLKYIYVSGCVLKEEIYKALVVDFPHISIRQMYGLSEVGGIFYQHSERPKAGSCGTIARNVQMKVIDTESGVILGPNEKGEPCIKTPTMMTCYYKNPKATSEKIDAEGWMHTGDLAHYDEQGNLFVTDRIEEMIKCKGQLVSSATIEQVLQAHSAVFEVGVVGIPNNIDGEHAVAFVAKRPNAEVTKEELMKLVTDKLPDYMELRGGLQFLDELPHTPAGKISKRHLRTIAQTGKAS